MTIPEFEWSADDELRVDGIEFHVVPFGGQSASATRFTLLKTRPMLESYVKLIEELAPRRIVELGVFAGGSTALLELLASPEKLVAFEIHVDRLPALDDFLRNRGASERVRPHFGIEQTDAERIIPILHDELGPELALDLVVDDASHALDRTRQSFNLLFPHLRPGGAYVVEDWGWGHFAFARERRGPSLAKLILELVLSLPYSEGMIDRIELDRFRALLWRGDAAVDPSTFELSDHVSPRGRQLLAVEDEDPRLQ